MRRRTLRTGPSAVPRAWLVVVLWRLAASLRCAPMTSHECGLLSRSYPGCVLRGPGKAAVRGYLGCVLRGPGKTHGRRAFAACVEACSFRFMAALRSLPQPVHTYLAAHCIVFIVLVQAFLFTRYRRALLFIKAPFAGGLTSKEWCSAVRVHDGSSDSTCQPRPM